LGNQGRVSQHHSGSHLPEFKGKINIKGVLTAYTININSDLTPALPVLGPQLDPSDPVSPERSINLILGKGFPAQLWEVKQS
jgi:hypothetical protein